MLKPAAIITATNRSSPSDIVGAPCMREGKIERSDPESCFDSDSINHLPLLERVTHPVAVDPDPRLAQIARPRGWRSLSLR